MRTLRHAWFFVAVLLLLAGPTSATIGPPVDVRLLGEPRAAKAGETFEGILEITSFGTGQLTDFDLSGQSWSSLNLDVSSTLHLTKDEKRQVRFSAKPVDPHQPLELEFYFNGSRVYKTFDLSEENYLRTQRPSPTAPAPDLGPEPTPSPAPPLPWGEYSPHPSLGPVITKGSGRYTIRVRGRFTYIREDTQLGGATGIGVSVVDARMDVWEFQTVIGSQLADLQGYYDIECEYTPTPEDDLPDIQVIFSTWSPRVWMFIPTWLPNYYTWGTAIEVNYSGTDLELGSSMPASDFDFQGVHLYTNVYRAWLYCFSKHGYDTPLVGIYWPDSDHAYYSSNNQTIHIPAISETGWSEGTHVHEYGHHWMHQFSYSPPPDYCNDICEPFGRCSHCMWCWEMGSIAWTEGFPNFMGYLIPESFLADYGQAALHPYWLEGLAPCDTTVNIYHDPNLTEGFCAAVLQDLADAQQDTHNVYGAWGDAMTVDPQILFDVAHVSMPGTPLQFLQAFLNNHPSGSIRNDIWETAKNCGYELDAAPPGMVTNLISTSHQILVPSADPTIDFTWSEAPDDAAGILGYSVLLSNPLAMPSFWPDIGPVTEFTTEILSPGYHYFSIRALDRAGNWSGDYNWIGPYAIMAAASTDLEFVYQAGWAHPLVPRADPDATPLSCPEPTTLPGDLAMCYWNLNCRNGGVATTPSDFAILVFADGIQRDDAMAGPLAGGEVFQILNEDVWWIRSGRHTFEVQLDSSELIPETDESNNRWAHQWVWTPHQLTAGTPVVRLAPPDRDAGWASVMDGSPVWYNCDGLRFTSSSPWNALVIRPLDPTADYDCRLHYPSTGATSGFAGHIGYSTTPAGYLDMLFVNRYTMGTNDWDVGVLNSHEPADADYEARHVTNLYLMVGDSVTVHYDTDEMLKLWRIFVDTGPRPISITVQSDPSTPVWALYLDETFTTGTVTDNDGWSTTLDDGIGRIDIEGAAFGYHCLVVYRNPIHGTDPIDVTIEIEDTPPNFQPFIPDGWYRPLVPRPLADGAPTQVDLPDTLHGNILSTYLNLAVRNLSPTSAPFLHGNVHLDGVATWDVTWNSPFPGQGELIMNWEEPQTIRGGRHTLAARLDELDEVIEISEADNNFGDQYCWSPPELSFGLPVTRPAPPDRMGNWEDVFPLDYPLWYNCDGLRLPDGTSYWQAVAVMPGAASNVDVRLHEALEGTKNGFAASRVSSVWGTGESDYVLVNFNMTARRPFDAGLVRLGSGLESYTAVAVGSSYLEYDGDETYGPYEMDGDQILHLWEFFFMVGTVNVHLQCVDEYVDWGLTLHPAGFAYQSKVWAVPDGTAWLNGTGEDETFTVDIPEMGFYCLAVWKRDFLSLYQSGTYHLHLTTDMTGIPAEGETPRITGLSAVYPNPFNPQTRIEFDLQRELPVKLEIFDLQGARVRTLVDEVRPAARYVEIWDGRNDSDQLLASGVYFARLVAGHSVDMRKLSLVK